MHPTLWVAKRKSDFCKFCTILRNDLDGLQADNCRNDCRLELLAKHVVEAREEHRVHHHLFTNSKDVYDGSVQHMAFGYAEKV